MLDIVDIFVEKRGENYLASLPDSVNFLVEALEDEDYQIGIGIEILGTNLQ